MYRENPRVMAQIKGGSTYPDIVGTVTFEQTRNGVLVNADIHNLPYQTGFCAAGIFAFHIHAGEFCTGTTGDEFADTLSHYNPHACPHPYHAGDLPPLFSNNNGYVFMEVLTDRFSVDEIIGKTILIHEKPDDFTTQPSGGSGPKIACGKIVRIS